MLSRSGYRALPLGDFDRFQQSSFGFLGSQKGCLSPERGGVGPGAGEWPPSTADPGRAPAGIPGPEVSASQESAGLAPLHSKRRDREGTRCGERPGLGMGCWR